MAGGHAWQGEGACVVGGEHGGRVCMVGACMVEWGGGVHGRGSVYGGVWGMGVHGGGGGVVAWQEIWPLQQMVRILLECILVLLGF